MRKEGFKGVKKVLVIKLRHIGDVLLSVPAFKALRAAFPSARITALVNEGTEEMLTLHPAIDEVIVYRRGEIKGSNLAARVVRETRFFRDLRSKGPFDMTVDLTGGDRAAIISFLLGARYRVGYEPGKKGFAGKKLLYTHVASAPDKRTHTVLRDVTLLKAFGIEAADLTLDIRTSPGDDSRVTGLLKAHGIGEGEQFVHTQPTSRWFFKCWRDDYTAWCLDNLIKKGMKVVITSASTDKEMKRVASITALMKERPVDLSGKLTLKEMASLSRRAVMFFGVDSAPMHIAAAAGTRVVALFGPSGSFDWGPWDNAEASRPGFSSFLEECEGRGALSPYPLKNGVQRFGRNVVIQESRACVPCGKDGCEGTKRSDCLEELSKETVWEVLEGSVNEALSKGERAQAGPF